MNLQSEINLPFSYLTFICPSVKKNEQM